MNNQPTHLYFMFNPVAGLIKIGVARDVADRRRSLECGCGCALEVLAVVQNGWKHELPLHDAFAPSRQLGEWFLPTADLLGIIEQRESIADLLKRKAPEVQAARIAREAALEEKREADRVVKEAERQALLELKRQEKALAKAREQRSLRMRLAREEKERKVHEQSMREAEALRQRWVDGDTSVLHDAAYRADETVRHQRIAKERADLVRRSQRARNCAINGVAVSESA